MLVFGSENEDGKICYKKLFFGCLSLAGSVACRPTQVFASILIIPIILKIFINNLKEKKCILKNIFVVVIPYLVVAIFLMRYNYIRFGSPFEFGEKYQLTVNNMKELDLRWNLLPTGLLCNLFGLPTFQATFPFIHTNANIIDTYGYYYIEDMVAGAFFLAPISFFNFGIFKIWKKIENKELKIFLITLLSVGFIFVSFISLKAGSTCRYLLDFAWIFVLCGIVIFMEFLKNLKTYEGQKILSCVFNFCVCFTIIINMLSGFCIIGNSNSMRESSPEKYFKSEYTIMILK